MSPRRKIGPKIFGQQPAIDHDGGEQIVEVMRNAAYQSADRFHLLRFQNLIFQRALIGNVAIEDNGAYGSLFGLDRSARDGDLQDVPVAVTTLGGDAYMRAAQCGFAEIAGLCNFVSGDDQLIEISTFQLLE